MTSATMQMRNNGDTGRTTRHRETLDDMRKRVAGPRRGVKGRR
jgi:hypothetical protein